MKNVATRPLLRAERFHQTDFTLALEHRRGRGGGDGKRRSDQRRERYHPKQRGNAAQDLPFALGHVPDGPRLDARQRLLDLVGNRGNVGAAVPAVEFGARHRARIALREGVFRFGDGAYHHAAKLARLACKPLRDGERR